MVECDLAKVEVAGSNPVSRSIPPQEKHHKEKHHKDTKDTKGVLGDDRGEKAVV